MTSVQRNFHSGTHSLLIGRGRLALHLKHYLQLLKSQTPALDFSTWDRSLDSQDLQQKLKSATHVWLAISDKALLPFYEQHLKSVSAKICIVHFSGALELSGMHGAHPLMTFGPELYENSFYEKIPFVLTGPESLQQLLPGLPNPSFRIHPQEKAYYHALCVLGGNLTTLLLQKMLTGFESLELPPSVAQLYIEQVMHNVFKNPTAALTGPLARKDFATVEKNLNSLKGDSYADVYRAFLPIVYPEYQEGIK